MVRFSRAVAYISASLMVLAWLLIAGVGDLWWWTLPLVYGPRWVIAALFVGLLPALFLARRAALYAGVVMTFVFVFGLLDFRFPFGRLQPRHDFAFRVLEMNAGGTRDPEKLAAMAQEITRLAPQVVVIAECSSDMALAIGRGEVSWWVKTTQSRQCFGTRLPLLSWEERDPRDFWKMNGSGAIARAMVDTPQGPLRIGVVHLETPREALQEFVDISSIPSLGDVTRANIKLRELESSTAREWIFAGDATPTLVVGDFNLPVESAIFRRHWSDLRNAFTRAGFGIGNTKRTRYWGSRIDHILTTDEFVTTHAGIGNDVQSDHRPLYADLTVGHL